MKIIKTASGKYKLTKKAWEEIGKKTGWTKESQGSIVTLSLNRQVYLVYVG